MLRARIAAAVVAVLIPSALARPGYAGGKPSSLAKAGQELTHLHRETTSPLGRRSAAPSYRDGTLARVVGGKVLVDAFAVTPEGGERLRADLEALGATRLSVFGAAVSGWLPIDEIPRAEALASLALMRPATAMTRAGEVTSQGAKSMRAPHARKSYGVSGAGITVGTLSDSFDCSGSGAPDDVASGDLPDGVVVLDDTACLDGGSDEGRAMMQIVHDVAPGAAQAFHTAFNGQADFANGILELASVAGAQVIVDDVFYLAEPMLQDGIIAQAVDAVAGLGVTYLSSAGNSGRQAYQTLYGAGQALAEAAFPSALGAPPFFGGTAHDFGGGDVFQRVSIPEGARFTISLQWDSPFFSVSGGAGSPNDVDVYVLDDPPTQVLAGSIDVNTGLDPVEVLDFRNPPGSGATTFNVLIVLYEGPSPGLIKYVRFGGSSVTILEHDTASGTVFGHSAARGAVAVGAAFYAETPKFGVAPPLLEPFSSAGPVPILFQPDGSPVFEIRDAPAVVAPDGGDTTFFVPGVDVEPNGWPNFFGTSAAAPHLAGVAALLLEYVPGLAPASALGAMVASAIDMGPPGFDDDSGHGLVQADAALAALTCKGLPATIAGTAAKDVLFGTPGDDVIVALGGNDRVRARGGDDVVCGGAGNDRLIGNSGADLLDGGAGEDDLRGGAGDDTLRGRQDDDRLDGGDDTDTLRGGSGTDVCLNGELVSGCP